MADPTKYRHPKHGELYTPITPEILELFESLHRRYGTWAVVAYHTKTRVKVLRNLRRGRRKAISMMLLDRILTETGSGDIETYDWFTADDLVKMGIWKPTRYLAPGSKRLQGGVEMEALTPQQRRLIRRKPPKKKWERIRDGELP